MEATVILRYEGTRENRFDRDYYLARHIPRARQEWASWLVDIRVFFVAGATEKKGTAVICECVFRDEAAMKEAFTAPCTAQLIADIPNFTDMAMSPGVLSPLAG